LKKTILEIYALAVCFAAIVCFVIVLGIGIYDIIEIIKPEYTLKSYEHERHQSNDAFWEKYSCYEEKVRPSEEELTKIRLESYQKKIESERRNAFQSLTRIIIILVINVIVFIIHWRIARHARQTNVIT